MSYIVLPHFLSVCVEFMCRLEYTAYLFIFYTARLDYFSLLAFSVINLKIGSHITKIYWQKIASYQLLQAVAATVFDLRRKQASIVHRADTDSLSSR